jgi:Amt family ammonium transporter
MLMGFVGGIACYFMVVKVKHKLGYDDSLDAFGVHGIGGTVGAILTGVFASRAINPGIAEGKAGLLEGNAMQVVNQTIGSLIAYGFAVVGTLVILKICDLVCGGVRVEEHHEVEGLDLALHGEEGYNLEA